MCILQNGDAVEVTALPDGKASFAVRNMILSDQLQAANDKIKQQAHSIQMQIDMSNSREGAWAQEKAQNIKLLSILLLLCERYPGIRDELGLAPDVLSSSAPGGDGTSGKSLPTVVAAKSVPVASVVHTAATHNYAHGPPNVVDDDRRLLSAAFDLAATGVAHGEYDAVDHPNSRTNSEFEGACTVSSGGDNNKTTSTSSPAYGGIMVPSTTANDQLHTLPSTVAALYTGGTLLQPELA